MVQEVAWETRWHWALMGTMLALLLTWPVMFTYAAGEDIELLQRIYAEVIPAPGTDTSYGIPLAWANLPQFLDWFYTITLTPAERQVFEDALSQLVAPCCDDNTMVRCCCEKGGRGCNLVRSGKGLAAYLVHDKGFAATEVRAAVLQWLKFVRPDYYVARALQERGISPAAYDLTTHGSCYRGLCEVAISQGGCGGMSVLIEPEAQGEPTS